MLAAVVLAVPHAADASLAPRTGDVLVSTNTTGTRHKPSVAATGGGHYLVVWEDGNPEVEGVHIRGRMFDRDGTLLGTEFQVDTAGSHYAEAPSIVRTEDGVFVVTWRSDPRNGERARLLGQRIDSDGAAIGTAFQLNTPRELEGAYYLGEPATAPVADGGFVVVWSSGVPAEGYYSFGPTSEIYARRFLADGVSFGADQLVSTAGTEAYTYTEFRPDIETLADSRYIVVWAQGHYTGFASSFQTAARSLSENGEPSGTELVVGRAGERGPRVVARQPSGFTVAWSTFEPVDYRPSRGGDVVARSFDLLAQPLADRFQVSTPATGTDPHGDPRRPHGGIDGVAAGAGAAGEFVVAWADGADDYHAEYYGNSHDGDDSGIFARHFTPSDVPLGGERQVNAVGEHEQTQPDLVFADADTLAIVWSAREVERFRPDRIYARIFDLITPECGDADEDGNRTAGDALFVLQSAIGVEECGPCLCDVNSSGNTTAGDALSVLQSAVGMDVTLTCPPPCTTTTTAVVDECFDDSSCEGRSGGPHCCGFVCAECAVNEHCPPGFHCDGTCTCVPDP